MKAEPGLLPPRRLLVRGVNWLGDAVMTTPAMLRLREALPRTHITLLTSAKLADLWQRHPAVDSVITFKPGEGPWTVGRRLRPGHFDHALILPNSPRSALDCLLAGIPRRIGFRRTWRNWMLTDRIAPRSEAQTMHKPSTAEIRERLAGPPALRPHLAWAAHHSLDYLRLAAVLGARSAPLDPLLAVGDDETDAARLKFRLTLETPWLGLNPGAEYGPAKRWPADRFADVARRIAGETKARWIGFGGRNDQSLTAELAQALPAMTNLAGQTTLRELMAVTRICRVFLTNDTGPMHVAAALGVPVVVPFGSTSPELTGPGLPGDPRHRLVRTDVACSPCFLRECPIDFRCMHRITVDRVVDEVRAALAIQGRTQSPASPLGDAARSAEAP